MVHIDHRGTPEQAIAVIATYPHEELCKSIVSDELNRLIVGARRNGEHFDPIPYAGWFWRSVQFFSEGGVTIADTGQGIAVCQNNKWDYPERCLTPEEQAHFTNLVWEAYQLNNQGGQLSEIIEGCNKALEAAGNYISNLKF